MIMTLSQFVSLKRLLSKFKGSNFLLQKLPTLLPRNMILYYSFSQKQNKLLTSAFMIVMSVCKFHICSWQANYWKHHSSFYSLGCNNSKWCINSNMWKILNQKSWIAQKEVDISKALELQIHQSFLITPRNGCHQRSVSHRFEEQYHQAVELANKY